MPPFVHVNAPPPPSAKPPQADGPPVSAFQSMMKNLKAAAQGSRGSPAGSANGSGSGSGNSLASTSRDRDAAHEAEMLAAAKRPTGSSSRGAGVKPRKALLPLPATALEPVFFGDEMDMAAASSRREALGGHVVAGPSRGGFIVQATKSQATVAASTPGSPAPSPSKTPTASPHLPTIDIPFFSGPSSPSRKPPPLFDKEAVLPPSKILPRLLQVMTETPDPGALVPLINLLATSVGLYPFPPPTLAASTLSEAIAAHPMSSPASEKAPSPGPVLALPLPNPLQIYLSQSHLLTGTSPPEVRAAVLGLLQACIEASMAAKGGLKESDKAVYWDEVRRWADGAKVEVQLERGSRWVLPDADREALVAVLSSITRGGRNLSDVPGLVALLCTFVTDSLPVPPPPSPLFDPTLETPFVKTLPERPSPHASSLALLTALHKFSASHIFSESTLLALRAALSVAKLQEERDIGGHEQGVLGFLSAVVRFGEVAGARSPSFKDSLVEQSLDRSAHSQGDEILREVVSVVARIVGCEGLVGVVEVAADASTPRVGEEKTQPSQLPALALELMRDLLRSPANQALKSLRATLVPPPDANPPATPVLLLVGALRSLRKALLEHSQDAEASATRGEASSLSTGESKWPSMLSLGLPFLWDNLRRVMRWKSAYVDAEVLRLVEERLEAAERVASRAREVAQLVSPQPDGRAKEVDDVESGPSYDDWDMAIEVLNISKWHINDWEDKNQRPWVWSTDDGSEDPDATAADEVSHFKQRPGVLAAFSSLLEKIVDAWRSPTFNGPSERVFDLLVGLAPHLSDDHAQAVIEQCEHNDLCLPSHPEWLERTQDVVRGFYLLPNRTTSSDAVRRTASTATRCRALQLLASLHSHVRHLESLRKSLVDTVIMPLLETTFEAELDVEVVEVLLALLLEVARDVLPSDETQDSDDGPLATFDRIRILLSRVARGSVRPVDRFSTSAPTTPKQRRGGAGLTTLSRYNSTATMRSAPSISQPVSGSSQQQTASPSDANEAHFLAVLALISIFHLCLARSTPSASNRAILVFRDLLVLLAPTMYASPLPDSPEVVVPLRTRLVILQWLVRLRADAAHRVHWVKDVDITASASILSRIGSPPEPAVEALAATGARTSEDGGRPEVRGRTARQPAERAGRDPSGSRLRVRSEDRSPSRGSSTRRAAPSSAATVAAGPMLWSVPESLPFDFADATCSVGGRGLASFDHNRMRNWTEEEDPGTGLMKVTEVVDTTAPEDYMVVLPVSEYLKALNHLLQRAHEWELVSYILCHLPEQLSNKHFACGPRAAQQIHTLRQMLCAGLRGGEQSFLGDVPLPAGLKRAEVHAAAYLCLTSLIAYRSLFTKPQQDDMVDTFMYGLGNPRDTAKVCIHALAMSSFELRPSMRKHLAEIVRHLQKIISSATLGVHILELIAGVGQEPSLYANFTEVDFQTVFGIALKYIQAHNERLADNPQAAAAEEGIEYAFSQYVFLLAYYAIAAWYMALRLAERPKYVPFLTRRLVQANEGKPEIDEATEVCFDMIARYAYSNADPRPRHSKFDKLITAGRASLTPAASATAKTWIVGTATLTVKSLPAPAWVEVTIRRPSGVVRMLWELQNISGVTSEHEADFIAMYLRHRESAVVSSGIASVVSEALATLPSTPRQPHLGHRARANSIAGTSGPPPSSRSMIEEATEADAINSAAHVASQPTLESGLLAVDPSFFTLQLSSFPEGNAATRPLLVPDDAPFQRGIALLDRMPVVDFHKIGVLYVGPGQTAERDILTNSHGSKSYIRLIAALGRLVRLRGSRELDIYSGGLDQESDIDGKWTYLWDDDISQIVFHIATLMPTSRETDPQATRKKAHIGNDFVKIIYNDSGGEFAFGTLPGDFNFVNIVIQPHTPAGNPWVGPGMTNNTEFFKVSMQCRPGMPEIGPLGTFKMVTAQSLPDFVRQLSLHSNIFAQVYLASVGFVSQDAQNTKLEYSSNWRKRLQQIKTLRRRILDSSGQREPSPPERLDLDAAEMARQFTNFLQ